MRYLRRLPRGTQLSTREGKQHIFPQCPAWYFAPGSGLISCPLPKIRIAEVKHQPRIWSREVDTRVTYDWIIGWIQVELNEEGDTIPFVSDAKMSWTPGGFLTKLTVSGNDVQLKDAYKGWS